MSIPYLLEEAPPLNSRRIWDKKVNKRRPRISAAALMRLLFWDFIFVKSDVLQFKVIIFHRSSITAVLNNTRSSLQGCCCCFLFFLVCFVFVFVFLPTAKCIFGGRQPSVIEQRLHSIRLIPMALYSRQNSWFVFQVHHMNFTFKLKFLNCYLVSHMLHQGFNIRILYSSFNFCIRDYH